MSSFSIECVLQCNNHLGEGPVWDAEHGLLYWLDCTGNRVGNPTLWRLNPRTGHVHHWFINREVGAMALRQQGGAVLAANDGFYTFDFDSSALTLISAVDTFDGRARLNDGKCDRKGRFFAGGMDDKEELGVCSLWRLDPNFVVTQVERGIICSNGPCWSPDDKTFYFADTFKKEMWQYDYDIRNGTLGNRRVFRDLHHDAGFADGSTVDSEGFVWNARVIAGELVRYAPDGSVDLVIGMPVRNITSVMFGGDKLDEIYVTSMARVSHPAAHEHFVAETKPQFSAGALFKIKGLGIKGLIEPYFAG
jgi:L-arabinonolactonase